MISKVLPEGQVNNWPVGDYNAFVKLEEATEERLAKLGEDDTTAFDRAVAEITALECAAAEMGLKRSHWLVRVTLAGVYGRFDLCWRGYYAETASVFLRMAGKDAMVLHGPEGMAWAKELAAKEREAGGGSTAAGPDKSRQDSE